MSLLTKEEILNQTLKTEIIDVPMVKPGAQVKIKELTSGRMDYFEASMMVDSQEGKKMKVKVSKDGQEQEVVLELFRARLVTMSLVDEDDQWLFEPGDETRVAELGCDFINVIAEKAANLNGMDDETIEQIKKDSGQTPEEDSCSDLQPCGDAQSGT